jgi:hypothetical protein
MTIQQAIKSGKPFKMKRWDELHYLIVDNGMFFNSTLIKKNRNYEMSIRLSAREVTSTDWEIKK